MTRTLLTGATGTLGQELQPRLLDAGHEVRAASRSPPEGGEESDEAGGSGSLDWVEVDLAEGTGIEAAVEDVDVVVHAASDPLGDTEAVDVRGTERLVEAAADAGVSNVLYVSIVGIDDHPYSYYQHKLAAEEIVEDASVPSTILRATQFHAFVDDLLGMIARLPIWPLPTKFRIQPVDEGEVAEAIVEHATKEAPDRAPDVGGPAVHTAGELATAYRSARGLGRPIVWLPLPGATASAFRAGETTTPDRAVGTVTWEEWLAETYE